VRTKELLLIGACLLAGASGLLAYSSNPNVDVVRQFSTPTPAPGETLDCSFIVTNNDAVSIRGFYLADQVPEELGLASIAVWIDGQQVDDFVYEEGFHDSVYTGKIPQRGIFETPSFFVEDNPIPPSGDSSAVIVYRIPIDLSTPLGTVYLFPNYSWVGELGDDNPIFGYQDSEADSVVVSESGGIGEGGPTAMRPRDLAVRAAPQPFSINTQITYTIPAELVPDGQKVIPIDLSIFDAAGRRVRTLARASIGPGVHTIPWDGRGTDGKSVSTGVYFVSLRLTSVGRVSTGKVIVVR
jgi:hypothetical protein